MRRILVALSGGVDSAVAALLLKEEGHAIEGAYMKNWINEDEILGDCPWKQDIEDASAVAAHLGIPFRVVNLMEQYRSRIVDYLIAGYQAGLTPNPDVMCNRDIKFGAFLDYALDEGFEEVATGHYARLAREPGGATRILEGADPNKDQSYFLALMQPEQIRRANFPVGHLRKARLRGLAEDAGLPNAAKKDSQGICFIGNIKMSDFLREYLADSPGPIIRESDGKKLGEHRGLHFYTIGQRKGIGIPSNADRQFYVVTGKDLSRNALLVAFESESSSGLYAASCEVSSLSFTGEAIADDATIEAKVRYRDPRVPIRCRYLGKDKIEATFAEPQRALAIGQVMAFYDGPTLLGGGIFARVEGPELRPRQREAGPAQASHHKIDTIYST